MGKKGQFLSFSHSFYSFIHTFIHYSLVRAAPMSGTGLSTGDTRKTQTAILLPPGAQSLEGQTSTVTEQTKHSYLSSPFQTSEMNKRNANQDEIKIPFSAVYWQTSSNLTDTPLGRLWDRGSPIHCCWECRRVQLLLRGIWQYSTKLHLHFNLSPSNPTPRRLSLRQGGKNTVRYMYKAIDYSAFL